MIFDTHAHYDDKAFDEDRDKVLASMKQNNIVKIVNVGANIEGSERSVALSESLDFVYASVGVHPDDAAEVNEEGLAKLAKLAENEKTVAIGEIGLDYYWNKENKEIQTEAFVKQIGLAKKLGLPIIVHSREACLDTMDILKENDAGINGGVIHCFSYSPEVAFQAIDMGFNIGIGGVVTFGNGKKLKDVVEAVPIEKIVLETDCPYLAPAPHRGERNSSLYLPLVVEMIANIKNMKASDVEEITYGNACRMYKIQ